MSSGPVEHPLEESFPADPSPTPPQAPLTPALLACLTRAVSPSLCPSIPRSLCRTTTPSPCQGSGFLRSEILQLYPPPDVEGSVAGVADQVCGRCHSQQAEGYPPVRWIFYPAVVALPDGSEELICGER